LIILNVCIHIFKMEPVMYFVVNDTLKMGKGKIGAQVAHAAIAIFRKHPDTPLFREWDHGCNAKVVLKASQEQLLALAEKYSHISKLIRDQGRTQVEPGSFTVLGFNVMEKDSNPDLVQLKLL
jgi:PTH2 family peptidyl-tRNA hydrolase